MSGQQAKSKPQGKSGRGAPRPWKRWIAGGLLGIGAIVVVVLVASSLREIQNLVRRGHELDRPLEQSLTECRVQIERQFVLTDRIVSRSRDARPSSNGWKSLLEDQKRLSESAQFAISAALQRAVSAEKKGLISTEVTRKLFELESLQDHLNDDMATLARLMQEERRDDALVPSDAIRENQTETRRNLRHLIEFAETRIATAGERSSQLVKRAGWTLAITALLGSILSLSIWRVARRRAAASFPTLPLNSLGALEIDLLADAPQPAWSR